jgi:hypothetical protein
MALEKASLKVLMEALECMDSGFRDLPDFESDLDLPAAKAVLLKVAGKMQDNYPPFLRRANAETAPRHPAVGLYAGPVAQSE